MALLKVCALAVALLALSAADAAARPISLAWDPSPEAVAGYRVYWSTQPGIYNETDSVDVGNSLVWTGDLPGEQYYFAVRAYDEEGHLGLLSLEIGETTEFWLSNPGDQSSETGQAVWLPLTAHGAALTYVADGLPDGLGVDPISGQIVGTVTASAVFPTMSIVTVRVVDRFGHVSSVQFYWTIRTPQPPMVLNPGDQTSLSGDAVTLPIGAVDPDGDTFQYSAGNLPTGLQIDTATGIISGTISPAATGVFDASVAVSDGRFVTTVRFLWQVLSDDSGLTVDSVVSADATGSMVTTLTTPPLSTALAGETLIAFVETATPTSDGAVVSGGGLEWSLVVRANAHPGAAEIWSARAPERLSNATVTADMTAGATFVSLTVVSFAGADGVGASAAASAVGAPAVSLTTTRAGSFVFGAGNDWDGMMPRTIPPGQEMVHEALGQLGDTFWVQRLTGAMAAAGAPVTINALEPTDHRFNIAAVEVLARSKAVPTVVLTPEVALPGSSLSASISGGPGNRADWAGLFRVTAHSTDLVAWQYLNGRRTVPRAGVTSAHLSFAAPAQPGQYIVRVFAETDRQTPIAVSNAILVPSCLSVDGQSMREGSVGSSSIVFTVRLSPASPVPVTVNYATADGTAKAGSDYVARSGTLVFAPGTTKQTIAVTIDGDTTFEPDESFSLLLSGATNAAVADANALGTIVNDDAPPVENQMFGFGAIDEGRLRQRFVFRVTDRNARNHSRLEFWSSEPIKSRDVDDDDRDGWFDTDYGRDHRKARNRFESTVISSVTFGPRDRNGGSVTFSGEGSWNDKSGFSFEARAIDRGEPGRGRDTFTLIIKDQHGAVVLNASGTLDQGNIQLTQSREHR